MFFSGFFINKKKNTKLTNSTCLMKLIFIFLFQRKCLKIIDSNLKKRIKKIKNDLRFMNSYYKKEIVF